MPSVSGSPGSDGDGEVTNLHSFAHVGSEHGALGHRMHFFTEDMIFVLFQPWLHTEMS